MIKFNVTDMHCMSCVRNIEDAIQEIDDSAKINADIDSRTLFVESSISEDKLVEIVKEEGYSIS